MKYSLAHAFVRYHRGLGKMPRRWKPWLMSLLMSNMIVPLFFLSNHMEAWVVLGTALLTGATFIALTAYSGFSRLLGFGHLPWVPMLVYLILRLPDAQQDFPETWFRFFARQGQRGAYHPPPPAPPFHVPRSTFHVRPKFQARSKSGG